MFMWLKSFIHVFSNWLIYLFICFTFSGHNQQYVISMNTGNDIPFPNILEKGDY